MECSKDTGMALLTGVGLGAGLAMLFDPGRGRRRRALIRDKAVSLVHQSQDAMGKAARDAQNRARGIAAEARGLLHHEEAPDDPVLLARVRSKLGRAVSHPHAINVMARNGKVSLSGPVLEDEVENVISAISKVPGVREVENRLEVHEYADTPALQGGRPREERYEWMQSNWSPAVRATAIAWGTGMIILALARRDGLGLAAGTLGACCLARGITNREFSEMLPIGRDESEDYYLTGEDIEFSRA